MGIVIKIVDWFTKNRNMLFLAVCLVIHVIYLCVFQILNVLPLVALNLFSSGFYFNFLVRKTMFNTLICRKVNCMIF